MREALADWLQAAGYAVRKAADGHAGLAAVKLATPALVVTDIYLPGTSGVGVIAELQHGYPEIPIIAISGLFNSGQGMDADTAIALGAARALRSSAMICSAQWPTCSDRPPRSWRDRLSPASSAATRRFAVTGRTHTRGNGCAPKVRRAADCRCVLHLLSGQRACRSPQCSGTGISFGGVASFIFGDLIILPILNIYRKYYVGKMTVFLAVTFYLAMVSAALVVEALFQSLGWVPTERHTAVVDAAITFNYTTVLDIINAMQQSPTSRRY